MANSGTTGLFQGGRPEVWDTPTGPAAYVPGTNGVDVTVFPPGMAQFDAPGGTYSAGMPFVVFTPYLRKGGFVSINSDAVIDQRPPASFAIALPVPSSALRTNYSVKYDTFDMGSVGGMIANNWKDVPSALEQLGAGGLLALAAGKWLGGAYAVPVLAASAIGPDATLTSLAHGIEGALSNLSGGLPVADMVKRASGFQENPFTETLFKTVDFRTHTFDYSFLPRNEPESKILDKIVQMFKFYMLPAYTDIERDIGAFFSFPYEFKIWYSVENTTFALMPSVLESFDVSYSEGTNAPKFFRPGEGNKQYPAKVSMSLKFKEIVIMTRDRVAMEDNRQVEVDVATRGSDTTKNPQRTQYRF